MSCMSANTSPSARAHGLTRSTACNHTNGEVCAAFTRHTHNTIGVLRRPCVSRSTDIAKRTALRILVENKNAEGGGSRACLMPRCIGLYFGKHSRDSVLHSLGDKITFPVAQAEVSSSVCSALSHCRHHSRMLVSTISADVQEELSVLFDVHRFPFAAIIQVSGTGIFGVGHFRASNVSIHIARFARSYEATARQGHM